MICSSEYMEYLLASFWSPLTGLSASITDGETFSGKILLPIVQRQNLLELNPGVSEPRGKLSNLRSEIPSGRKEGLLKIHAES